MGITLLQQAGILTVNRRGQNESAIIMFMVVFCRGFNRHRLEFRGRLD